MHPLNPIDPPVASPPRRSAEVAHVRRVLDVTGSGPESSRFLAAAVMESLIAQGHSDSVTWYLAPTPDGPVDRIAFHLRSSEDADPAAPVPPGTPSNRGRRRTPGRRRSPGDGRTPGGRSSHMPLAAVFAEARRLSMETGWVEVWSEDDEGVQRLVLKGGGGTALRYLSPELGSFAGEGGETIAAAVAWQRNDGRLPEPGNLIGHDVDGVNDASRQSSALCLVGPEPAATEVVGEDPRSLVKDAGVFAAAVQEALNQMSVEVDLGSIEEVVIAAVRATLAEAPPAADGVPGGDLTAKVDPAQMHDLVEELRRTVDASVTRAIETGLARHVPSAGAPGTAADSGPGSAPTPAGSLTLSQPKSFDPYDHARRLMGRHNDES